MFIKSFSNKNSLKTSCKIYFIRYCKFFFRNSLNSSKFQEHTIHLYHCAQFDCQRSVYCSLLPSLDTFFFPFVLPFCVLSPGTILSVRRAEATSKKRGWRRRKEGKTRGESETEFDKEHRMKWDEEGRDVKKARRKLAFSFTARYTYFLYAKQPSNSLAYMRSS